MEGIKVCMNYTDYVVVATAKNGHILAYGTTTRELVGEMQRRHDLWPVATAALGRVVSVAAMLSATLKKDEHQITLQVQGDGPLGNILVVVTGTGSIRGYVHEPHIDLPLNEKGKLAVGQAVGKYGSLYVIKDLGLKEPYRGSVPLVSGEIGDDFTYYFTASEQAPSAVAVGVLVAPDLTVLSAGGILLQLLPGATEEEIAAVEQALNEMPQVSSLLHQGVLPEEILERIFPGDVKILERKPVTFRCNCNKPRLAKILLSLGQTELDDMIKKDGGAELVCHFCSERYHFSLDELTLLRDQLTNQ